MRSKIYMWICLGGTSKIFSFQGILDEVHILKVLYIIIYVYMIIFLHTLYDMFRNIEPSINKLFAAIRALKVLGL